MYKYLFLATLSVCWILNSSFTLPVKQKEIIEKFILDGAFEKALSAISDIREAEADDIDLLLLKGICYYKLEEYKTQAIPTLLNALALSKNKDTDVDIIYHLAQAYFTNTDYKNAIQNYKRLQQIVPEKFSNFHKKIETQIQLCQSCIQASSKDTLKKTDSLFFTPDSLQILSDNTQPDTTDKHYTIQICTMSFPLSDSFFKGQYGVKLIRMGDLYRYIYNIYPSIEQARAALPTIRKIYPDAFIREFNEEKLGKAVDLNMDRIK